MRRLLYAVIALALVWSAYWVYGAGRETARIADWFDRHARAGHDALSTRGFPNRFDTSIARPLVDTGLVTWTAPLMQTLRLSYKPDHYVLAFDTRQTLTVNGMRISMTNGAARASAVFDGDRLDRTVLTVDDVSFVSGAGWTLAAGRILFASRRTEEGFDIGLDVRRLRLGGGATDVHVEGTVILSGGVPSGTLAVTATNPTVWAEIARATGLPDSAVPLTVTFADGRTLWGSVAAGPAPVLP